jgi:hypothetical protein
MTAQEMNRLLDPSYGEKGNAVDWRICRLRQVLKQTTNKKSRSAWQNGAAIEIKLLRYFFSALTFAQRARCAAAILARAAGLIFRRLRSNFGAATEPFPRSFPSSL